LFQFLPCTFNGNFFGGTTALKAKMLLSGRIPPDHKMLHATPENILLLRATVNNHSFVLQSYVRDEFFGLTPYGLERSHYSEVL
jgi:hypothetical protein